MQIKVADYIAGWLVDKGIKHIFTVTGGGAMHLNNAFGNQNSGMFQATGIPFGSQNTGFGNQSSAYPQNQHQNQSMGLHNQKINGQNQIYGSFYMGFFFYWGFKKGVK